MGNTGFVLKNLTQLTTNQPNLGIRGTRVLEVLTFLLFKFMFKFISQNVISYHLVSPMQLLMWSIASVASKKKIIFVHLNVHGKIGTNSSSRSLPQSMNAFSLTFMLCERRSERRSKNARSPILCSRPSTTTQWYFLPPNVTFPERSSGVLALLTRSTKTL